MFAKVVPEARTSTCATWDATCCAALSDGMQHGIKAVGGWKNDAEARTYTESVEQERLADVTLGRVIDRFSGD